MSLARAGRTGQQDVGLLDSPITEVGVGDDWIWSATIPAIDEALEVVADAWASRRLAMDCPTTYWSKWATKVLEDGIEARRASLGGRSGSGAGSGEGWGRGIISERALVAQKPQMRTGGSMPPSKRGMLKLKQKEQQGGSSDIRTPGTEAYQDHPRRVVDCPLRWCQFAAAETGWNNRFRFPTRDAGRTSTKCARVVRNAVVSTRHVIRHRQECPSLPIPPSSGGSRWGAGSAGRATWTW